MVIFITGLSAAYRRVLFFLQRAIEAFTARVIAAKTFLRTATDRIVICVNYISLSIRVLF